MKADINIPDNIYNSLLAQILRSVIYIAIFTMKQAIKLALRKKQSPDR
jgi:hypothetical protein